MATKVAAHSGRCIAAALRVDRLSALAVDKRLAEGRVMEHFTGRWCEFFLARWQTATSFEYCIACLLIVIGGWVISRQGTRVGY